MTLIAFATPTYGGMVHAEFAQSLLAAFQATSRRGIGSTWLTIGGSGTRRNRNAIVAVFLSDARLTHLLWVDSDTSFPPDAPQQLARHNMPVVAGLCPLKQPTESYALRFAQDAKGGIRFVKPTVAEVDRIGLAFVLIRRDALERMVEAYPERHLRRDNDDSDMLGELRRYFYDLHPEDLDASGAIEGEDYGFCRLWRALGGEIWVDLSIRLAHHGMVAHTSDPLAFFHPAAAPQSRPAA